MAEVLEDYLASLSTHVTKGTVDDYRRMVARTWGPRLGPIPVTALTRENVIEMGEVATRAGDRPPAPSTVGLPVYAMFGGVVEKVVSDRKPGPAAPSRDVAHKGFVGNGASIRNPDRERQLYIHVKPGVKEGDTEKAERMTHSSPSLTHGPGP